MAGYVWVDSIAEKWGVSKSWVYKLCRSGRVSGAIFTEGRWSVPEDAEKPMDHRLHKKYMRAVEGTKRLPLPENLLLKLPGEADGLPEDAERVLSDCSDYILDIVDVAPGSGRVAFAALTYPHVNAVIICENDFQYYLFNGLKSFSNEVYEMFSVYAFEFSMLTPTKQREYFEEKKRRYNNRDKNDTVKNAALLLFIAQVLPQRTIDVDRSTGDVVSVMKRRIQPSFCCKEDVEMLSSLLEKATVYRDISEAGDGVTFSEYSALHLSRDQFSENCFPEISKRVERLIII